MINCRNTFKAFKIGWLDGKEIGRPYKVSKDSLGFWIPRRAFRIAGSGFRQDPAITRSEQLPCARVTAISWTSLFLERFWREIWISFNFHIPVSKTYRLKNDIFCFLITFSFPFWYLILPRECAHKHGGVSIFAGKNALKCVQNKINWFVKTPWHRPSMGVAHF